MYFGILAIGLDEKPNCLTIIINDRKTLAFNLYTLIP